MLLLLRSHVFLKLSAQGGQKAVSLRKGGKETVAEFDVCVLITVGRGEKVCPGSNGFGIVFGDLLQGSFKFFTNLTGIQRMRFVRFFTKQLSVLEV